MSNIKLVQFDKHFVERFYHDKVLAILYEKDVPINVAEERLLELFKRRSKPFLYEQVLSFAHQAFKETNDTRHEIACFELARFQERDSSIRTISLR